MSNWISVDEPPEERVLVLVAYAHGKQVGVAHQSDGVWYTPEPQVICGTDITHWQPLPEPPQ